MIVYGSLKYKPLWGRILIKVSHLLLCLSSAVNIVIYYYKDFQFRSALMKNCNSCTGGQTAVVTMSLSRLESTKRPRWITDTRLWKLWS